MNNNNNIYNNNFIGTTHIDAYKSTSNFIISTSNTIESHLYASNIANSNYTTNTSNILEIHSRNYTNNLRFDVNKWINETVEHTTIPVATDITHTQIYNSNLGGEIQFWVKSTNIFPPIVNVGVPDYRVKIDIDGKLKIYYTYDPAISLTWGNGWVDIINVLIGLIAGSGNAGITIRGLQAEIFALQQKEEGDIVGVYNAMIALNEGDLAYDIDDLNDYRDNIQNGLNITDTEGNISSTYTNIRDFIVNRNQSYFNRATNSINLAISRNPLIATALGVGGVVFTIAYGISQNGSFNSYLNSIIRSVSKNSNLSNSEKNQITSNIQDTLISSNIIEIVKGYYDMGISQGFVNSNTITYQTIPQLQSSNIYMINSGNINNVGTCYMNVSQQNLISTSLNTSVGFPTSNLGGIGDKIKLRNGTPTTYPICIGIDSNYSLWHSIASNNSNTAFNWYIDGDKRMSLYKDRLDTSNLLLYQNGVSIKTFTQTTILNDTPNVSKKYGFTAVCITSILMPNNITYYKYDIDLRLYTINKISPNPNTPYRVFKIRIFMGTVYFETLASTGIQDNILEYTVYMSNESIAAGNGASGINICAIGEPRNYNLNSITAGSISLVRSGDYNFICVLAKVINTNINVIIEDLLF